MVEEERKSTQARLEAEFSKHRASLGELKSELDQVNAVLSEKKAALAQEEREAELVVTRIEEAVARRVADVLRQPETAIAEIPILRAILRPLRSDANAGPKVAPAASSTVLAWHVSGTRLQTPADVRKRLAQELKAHGASGEPSGALVAATLARKIPVVWGGGAQRALNAYADVIAHGRLWTVSVSPLLTRMPDLFGSVDQSARTFVPHADGLIDVIDGARRSKGYAVAVLEGINLAATEGFLLPLLNAIAADREIHVCHPRAIDPEDPYAAVLRFKWPRNLLLVATLIEGPTSLPLAGDLWRHSVLIRVDAAKTRDTRGGLELSELDPEIDTISLNAETSVAEHVFAEFEEFAGFIAPASEFAEHLVGSGTQREGEVAKALLLPLVSRHEMSEELAEKIARALNVDKQHARTLFLQTRGIVA
jgi:hypothetical protein